MVITTTISQKDLSVDIGKLSLKNPFIAASGTYGYADEYEDFVDLQNVGAIVTKGITLNPRAGNPQPRIGEVKNGLINSIGLENIGINTFVEEKLPVLLDKNINFIVNVAGFSLAEYIEIAKICQINGIKAIELNVSCPNVEKGCLEFAKDKDLLGKVISGVREAFENTLIVKLSPNVSSPAELAILSQNCGADAISSINTVKAMSIKTEITNGKLSYTGIKGGLSGKAIKPVALAYIQEISQVVNIPIIGMGGISDIADALEFIAVGSTAVQVGTANFTHPGIMGTLVQKLENTLIENNISDYRSLIEGK